LVADVTPRSASASRTVYADKFDAATIARQVVILAADSMEGRATGSPGGDRAARWITTQFKAAGLVPAGDSDGYLQRIPLRRAASPPVMPGSTAPSRGSRPSPVASWAQWDFAPADARAQTANVVGVLQGSDPPRCAMKSCFVTAHYDHIGIGPSGRR
jgi:hypothetical protein